jgi:hypothetical protein
VAAHSDVAKIPQVASKASLVSIAGAAAGTSRHSGEALPASVSEARAQGGREYILQHSPQRAGVTSVGVVTLPNSPKPATGACKQPSSSQRSPLSGIASAQKSHAVKPQAKAAKRAQQQPSAVQSVESAEATAWLGIARDDVQMLAGALTRASIDLADEDGETLLLCACRYALNLCASGCDAFSSDA